MDIKKTMPTKENFLTLQNGAKIVTITALTGLLLYSLLPILVSIVWNTISLAIGCAILFALFIILQNKKLWRSIWYLNEAITKVLFYFVIEFDEFIIQEQQILQYEKEVEVFEKERAKLSGIAIGISNKIAERTKEFETLLSMANEAKKDGDEESYGRFLRKAQSSKSFVEATEPILNNIEYIMDFSSDLAKKLEIRIEEAKHELSTQKDIYYTVKAGASALQSAKRALFGDAEMNADAELAKAKVAQMVSQLGGQIKTSIDTLKTLQKEDSYRDRAKVEQLKNTLILEESSSGNFVVKTKIQPKTNYIDLSTNSKYGDII